MDSRKMIKRIVQLTFREDATDDFCAIFEESKAKIRARAGCQHLELLRSTARPNVFFTFSHWDDEDSLNAYRNSELFKTTWAKTKILFADKPQAWSVEVASFA